MVSRRQRWNRFKAWLSVHTPISSRRLGCGPVLLKDSPLSIIAYLEDYKQKYGCELYDGDSRKWWEGWV